MKIHPHAAPVLGEVLFETKIPAELALKTPLAIKLASLLVGEDLVPESDLAKLEVCFEEGLKNAIVHGNCGCPERLVEARVLRDGHGWAVAIGDEGAGFTADKIPDPDHLEPWEESGRGIALMAHVCGTVEFFDGGRTLVLREGVVRTVVAAGAAAAEAGFQVSGHDERETACVQCFDPGSSDEAEVATELQAIAGAIEESENTVVLVDLSSISYLSSFAIGQLVALQKTCLRLDKELRLVGLNEEIQKVLSVLRLDSVFRTFATVEEAL